METRTNKKIRFCAKLAIFFAGATTLLPLSDQPLAAESRDLVRSLYTEQEGKIRHILTVCPAGPPTCQYAKIQDAIDAAPEDLSRADIAPPISKIQVGAGTYLENLVIRKSVILEGAGRDQVFLAPSSKVGQESLVGIHVIATCKENEIRDNQKGDFTIGINELSASLSPALKQKCEGG